MSRRREGRTESENKRHVLRGYRAELPRMPGMNTSPDGPRRSAPAPDSGGYITGRRTGAGGLGMNPSP